MDPLLVRPLVDVLNGSEGDVVSKPVHLMARKQERKRILAQVFECTPTHPMTP